MTNVIKPRRTPTAAKVPTTADLADGELGANTTDKKLYIRVGAAIVELCPSGAATWGSVTGTLASQTDLSNALNLKANLASPTFTGTVGGITKTMVGLTNVDNTSDVNKPVSTAQAAADNLRVLKATPSYSVADANSLTETGGLAFLNTASNTPTGDWATIFSSGGAARNFQIGNAWNTSAEYAFFIRRNTEGVFSPWYRLWNSGNFDPATKLGVSAKAADSELLDGIDSSRVVYGNNANKMTVAGGDWNTAQPNGFYEASGAINGPVAGWNWVINVRHSNTASQYGWQLSNPIGTNDLYVRAVEAGTWRAWNKLYTAGSGNINHSGGQISADSLTAGLSSTYINSNAGLQVVGTWRINGEAVTIAANGAAWVRNPRHFVQSTDPGAQASDGDLWFW